MNETNSNAIVAYVKAELDKVRAEVTEQIQALRNEVPVLDGWEEDKDYPHNTLCERDGSLFQFDAGRREWRKLVNVYGDVVLKKTDGFAVLEFTKEGRSFEREIRYSKSATN